ncbi:prolactin-inducible protein-like [Sigmodon hispidus]
MHSLSLRFGVASCFLVLCLQLGISKAQESTNVRRPLVFNLEVPTSAKAEEEITVKLGLRTEYHECMVIKAYLVSSEQMEGNFHFNQTRCLCSDYGINFYWDFPVHRTVRFAIVIEVIKEKNICPNDEAVVPIVGDLYYTYRTVSVY